MGKGKGERYTKGLVENQGMLIRVRQNCEAGTMGKKGHFQVERFEWIRAEMGREAEEGHRGGGFHRASTSSYPCRKWNGNQDQPGQIDRGGKASQV